MIAIIVVGIILLLLASLLGNSRRQRESQERIERHIVSQLPPPDGFDDCPAEAVQCVRQGQTLSAIKLHWEANGKGDLKASKQRIDELREVLIKGPALGRPPKALWE